MRFCVRCGQAIAENSPTDLCPNCMAAGNPANAMPPNYQQPIYTQPPVYQVPVYQVPVYGNPADPYDAPNAGFAVLSFFFPLIGLILYLVWKDSSPLKAGSCGKGALTGFILSICLPLITVLIATIFFTIPTEKIM